MTTEMIYQNIWKPKTMKILAHRLQRGNNKNDKLKTYRSQV